MTMVARYTNEFPENYDEAEEGDMVHYADYARLEGRVTELEEGLLELERHALDAMNRGEIRVRAGVVGAIVERCLGRPSPSSSKDRNPNQVGP